MAFYVFVGQNATTGKPNPKTGYYSFFGQCYQFRTKSERDVYHSEFRSNNPSEFCVKVNRRSARRYNLGMNMRDYNEYMDLCNQLTWCEDSKQWELI